MYAPNALARGLRKQQSATVGVLIPDFTNPLYPPMIRGIESVLLGQGMTALIANTDGEHDKQRTAFETLSARQVDGFIFTTAMRDDPFLRDVHGQGVRAVLLNRTTDEPLFPAVVSDDASGIQQVFAHLRKLGHASIAHLAGPENTSAGHDRRRCFEAAVAQAGLEATACPVVTGDGFTIEAGRHTMRNLLDSGAEITAVVAGNDLMAVGAMRELRSRGMTCPDDVSVAGYNDTLLSADIGPGLTTVSVPLAELGRAAAAALLADTATQQLVRLPVHLTVRGSTSQPRLRARKRARKARASGTYGLEGE